MAVVLSYVGELALYILSAVVFIHWCQDMNALMGLMDLQMQVAISSLEIKRSTNIPFVTGSRGKG